MVCDFRALISPHIQISRITVSIMTLRFNSDGTFRVLQMADIQDGPNVRKDTIRLIEAAIKKTHPNLIVFTGDQIRGYDPAYIDTFLRRRGEQPGTRVRIVTKIEAKLRGIKRHGTIDVLPPPRTKRSIPLWPRFPPRHRRARR